MSDLSSNPTGSTSEADSLGPPSGWSRPGSNGTGKSGEAVEVYRCRVCENVSLSVRAPDTPMDCCGESMTTIDGRESVPQPSDVRRVLHHVFGLPKPSIDICLSVARRGATPAAEVAEELDYDKSTVIRYLNQLVEAGFLDLARLNRKAGGFVNVYTTPSVGEMRRESLVGFCLWAAQAARLIEETNRARERHVAESSYERLTSVFWEDFENGADSRS